MTQPGSVSQVTVKAGQVTSLGTIVAGTLIANTSTASAIYVSQSTSVSATNGLRVGPLGSVSWTDSTPCYIAVDGQLDVTVTLSTVSANLSSPLDVADAIHKDGVSISGPVTIDGTVPIDGTVTISAPVTIDGTVPITGTVNANISGPVTVETTAGTPLDVNATGTVSLTGPVEVTTPTGTPLDVNVPGTVAVSAIQSTVNIATAAPIDVVASGTVNVNPVTIEGTVPVTGTVELGTGTTVSINGGVEISGPVTVDGSIEVINTVNTMGSTQLLSSFTYTTSSRGPNVTNISGYASILIQLLEVIPNSITAGHISISLSNGNATFADVINIPLPIPMSGYNLVLPNYHTQLSAQYVNGANGNYIMYVSGLSSPTPGITTTSLLTTIVSGNVTTASNQGIITFTEYLSGKISAVINIQNVSGTSVSLPQLTVTCGYTGQLPWGTLGTIPATTIPYLSDFDFILHGVALAGSNNINIFVNSTGGLLPNGLNIYASIIIDY